MTKKISQKIFPNIGALLAHKNNAYVNENADINPKAYSYHYIYLGKKMINNQPVYRLWAVNVGYEVAEYSPEYFFPSDNCQYIILVE